MSVSKMHRPLSTILLATLVHVGACADPASGLADTDSLDDGESSVTDEGELMSDSVGESSGGDEESTGDGGEPCGSSISSPQDLSDVTAGSGGFVLHAEGEGGRSGFSVSSAGDVNGDGLSDFIVGAPSASPEPFTKGGRSYVVFGRADSGDHNLADIAAGIGGFVVDGASFGEASGWSVSGAGDVNGDGLADLLIGALGSGFGGTGNSYVVFGKSDTEAVKLSDVQAGTGGYALVGETPSDSLGQSVSGVGDVNGDGLADLLLGAPDAGINGSVYVGRAYVVFGKADTDPLNLSEVSGGSAGFSIDGEAVDDLLGAAVSGIGDFNGDGLADAVIISGGRGYVIFGRTEADAIDLSDIRAGIGGFAINGEAAGSLSGAAVSGAGDVNGDGLSDLIIGVERIPANGEFSGRSYVVLGKTDTDAVELSEVTAGSGGFAINGETELDHSGGAVSSAGDVNGDGLSDLIIGAWQASPNEWKSGRSYVLFGKEDTNPVELSEVTAGNGGFALSGEVELDRTGMSVSGAGDINGDGLSDLIVGAPLAGDSASESGHTYVVFGVCAVD